MPMVIERIEGETFSLEAREVRHMTLKRIESEAGWEQWLLTLDDYSIVLSPRSDICGDAELWMYNPVGSTGAT